jgi:hypothetical protein
VACIYKRSSGMYVRYIQKPRLEASGRSKTIPAPSGTLRRHMRPCRRSADSEATSAFTVATVPPCDSVRFLTGSGSRFTF